tara:strand:- start:1380 stop:1622 length:243 start_codon:yes stop_codon:yes gene_type:complete
MLVKNNFEELQEKIKILEEKINEQNEKLDLILDILNNDVKVNCSKMSEHIDFIEAVYNKVKSPMYYICSKFENIPSIGWY